MKKIISIMTIAALAGILAIGCSTPEETGKTGETTGAPTAAGSTDTNADSGKVEEGAKTDEAANAGDATKTGDAGKMEEGAKTDEAGKSGDAGKTEENTEDGK